MDKTKALQNLLKGKATKKEIELLQQALANGDISIGRDVNRSIVITGDGNTISLTPEALRLLSPEPAEKVKTEEPVDGEPPYMGLRYFDTSDANLFFGREVLTRELLARVQRESFLAIVGASGSGKSSIARAGLIPAWTKENAKDIVHVITPTAHPLENLAASLTRDSESVTATSTLMDDLQRDTRSLRLFVKKSATNLLLLVDQFEETFTLCKDSAERKSFIENLLSLADDDGSARVVITLRADFYHHCAEYEGLRLSLEKHQAYIGAMTVDELRQAITAPAEKNGWNFEPALVDLILQDVGSEPGALPLLSHALLETWKRRQGRTLTLKGYAEAGGVKKAIAQTAESVYDKLTPDEQTIARGIFLRLTELGEGVQDTRRRVKLDELGTQDLVGKVLKTLTDARLVTTEEDSAEVAHEALIREWGTLRKWLDEDREGLRLHRHLTESAQEWKRRGKEYSELYRGARLVQLQDWMKEHGEGLSSLEREFVRASRTVQKRELMSWSAIAGAGVALLLAVILAINGVFDPLIYRPIDMEDHWVTIPGGEFQIGDDVVTDGVYIVNVDEFQIGKYEVTKRQYAQCAKAGVCAGSVYDESKALHPVANISWYDAVIYCEWIGGRLPTEAEWEKAASWNIETQTKFVFPWGNEAPSSNLSNYNNNVGDTTPVGAYPAGQNGLYDMAGNVWEWVNDWYQSDYYATLGDKAFNPRGPSSGISKVLRGGSWGVSVDYLRSAVRTSETPTSSYDLVGFRCARSLP